MILLKNNISNKKYKILILKIIIYKNIKLLNFFLNYYNNKDLKKIIETTEKVLTKILYDIKNNKIINNNTTYKIILNRIIKKKKTTNNNRFIR